MLSQTGRNDARPTSSHSHVCLSLLTETVSSGTARTFRVPRVKGTPTRHACLMLRAMRSALLLVALCLLAQVDGFACSGRLRMACAAASRSLESARVLMADAEAVAAALAAKEKAVAAKKAAAPKKPAPKAEKPAAKEEAAEPEAEGESAKPWPRRGEGGEGEGRGRGRGCGCG